MPHLIRKLLRLLPLAALFLLLLARSALAADPPPAPDIDASAWAKALYAAITEKQWGIVSGVLLVGLVYPLRLWGPKFLKTPGGGLILAMAIALAGTFVVTLAAGTHMTLAVAASALATAATAAGLWEWLKAHVPGMQSAANKATS